MSYIKILRLKNGTDIISFIEMGKKTLKLRYPVSIELSYDHEEEKQELLMKYWLPVGLIEENSAELLQSEFLVVLEPKQDFKEYYLNFLNDFNVIPKENNEDSNLLKVFLESLDKSQFDKIH